MTFYLSPSGHDANPGTLRQPWAGFARAFAALKPGDALHLLPGVHRPRVAFSGRGRPDKWITIEGEPGAIIDPSDQCDWVPVGNLFRAQLPADSTAATYANVTCQVFDGCTCTPMARKEQLSAPPEPLLMDGALAYDLTWYDAALRTLWFRSNELEPISNPAADCRIISSGTQFHVTGAKYLRLQGLSFRHGYFAAHVDTSEFIEVEGCRFESSLFGLVAHARNLDVVDCHADWIGGSYHESGGVWRRDWKHHAYYLTTDCGTVRGNEARRIRSGCGINVTGQGQVVIEDNEVYEASSAGLLQRGVGTFSTRNKVVCPCVVPWRGKESRDGFFKALQFHATDDSPAKPCEAAASDNYFEGDGVLISLGGRVKHSLTNNRIASRGWGLQVNPPEWKPDRLEGNVWSGQYFNPEGGTAVDGGKFRAWCQRNGYESQDRV